MSGKHKAGSGSGSPRWWAPSPRLRRRGR